LLSQIAYRTFATGNYFFKQNEVEQQIREFIENLPGARTDEDALNLDSEAVLKAIEAQHDLFVERARGIYSFSHLTFHEYFAAREVKEKSHFPALGAHLTDKRWREVTLLAVGMVSNADTCLQQMKQTVDSSLAGDEKLQRFLGWVDEKARSVNTPYKPAAIRAVYFAIDLTLDLDRALDFDRAIDLDRALNRALTLNRALDPDLDLDLDLNRALDRALDPGLVLDLALALDLTCAVKSMRSSDASLKLKVEKLCRQTPKYVETSTIRKQWWQENGQAWRDQLRTLMIEHRNIGHDWQFSEAQQKQLQHYYYANKLLVACLNSDCYVSRSVREEIEATLVLPFAKIESR
jgi:predicted NACHT family NTPase